MFILGKTNAEVGKQLEELTLLLLSKLPFDRLKTNSIDVGGSEVDVYAEFQMTGLTEQNPHLIRECKARQDPVNITDWLKFLGKVFQHETVSHKTTYGCLLALNGANGNVFGAYTSLRPHCDRVMLLDAEAVRELAGSQNLLCSQAEAESSVRAVTERPMVELKPAYYGKRFYWICGLETSRVLVLDKNGVPLDPQSRDAFIPLLAATTQYTAHLDLDEEGLYLRRQQLARKLVIGRLFSKGSSTMEELTDSLLEYQTEVPLVVSSLVDLDWITVSGNKIRLKTGPKWSKRFANIASSIWSSETPVTVIYEFLGSPLYRKSINEKLWRYALQAQSGLPVPLDRTDEAIQLMWLSPLTLVYFTQPQEMFLKHKEEGFFDVPTAVASDVEVLFNMAAQLLRRDFNNPYLMGFFYKHCEIEELEAKTNLRLKSREQVVVEYQATDRHRIGIATDEYGGIYLPMFVPLDAAEPWASGGVDERSKEAAYDMMASGRSRYGRN